MDLTFGLACLQMEEQLLELRSQSSCQQHLQTLADSADLNRFSLSELENLSQHIKKDMERVEQVGCVVLWIGLVHIDRSGLFQVVGAVVSLL